MKTSRPVRSLLFSCALPGLALAPSSFGAEVEVADSKAILRELTDFSLAGMNRRLGPDYAFYHPNGGEDFPEIYLAPEIAAPVVTIDGVEIKRRYQIGGPWTKEAGDFSSTQGQILYVPDRPLKIDPKTRLPNEGVGVDRVTIIEWTNNTFTERPEPPWWGGFRPEPTAKVWVAAKGEKLGLPIASARGMGGWSNGGLIVFSSGMIGTAGTVTARGTDPMFTFPSNKLPTAISITNKNEFALVTVVDTEKMKGQVAVLALTGGGEGGQMPHEWPHAHPGLANVGVFTGIKLLGYIDLPGITFPTGVSAVGNHTGGRVEGPDGNAGLLNAYDLSRQEARDKFYSGSNSIFVCTAGFAVVISKHENKAAFIDLQPLFDAMRAAYLTTEENYQKTRDQGSGPKQWPHTFEGEPAWIPKVVRVVPVDQPTAVLADFAGDAAARAYIASQDGTVTFYKVGGLATEAPASSNEVTVAGTVKVGRNPICLTYPKSSGMAFVAVSRGDREIDFVTRTGDKAEVVHRIRDRRLLDPVYAEFSDTHGIEGSILTVADFKGRKIVNYRYGTVVFATQSGARYGSGPAGKDTFECGGILEFPGHPFSISATNVN